MSKKRDSLLNPADAKRFGLSEEYWERVGPEGRDMCLTIRPLRTASYSVDHHLHRLEDALATFERDVGEGGTFELNPDFQRGHVWTQAQQVAYVENVLRGVAPVVFRFNHPSFFGRRAAAAGPDDLPPNQMTCIDGLQRITALRAFLAGDFKVFDRWYAKDLDGSAFSMARYRASFEVFNISTRSELLSFYLDLNAGGTIHTDVELDRVRALRAAALASASEAPPKTSQKMKIK